MTNAMTTEPTATKPKATYSIPELAETLGVSQRHVHRLKDLNQIPGLIKLGGRVLFSRGVIDRWLANAK